MNVDNDVLNARLKLQQLRDKGLATASEGELLDGARTSFAVGLAMYGGGNYTGAAEYLSQAVNLFQVCQHKKSEVAECWYYLGKNCFEQEDFEKAEQALRKSLDIFEKFELPPDALLATIFDALAHLFHDRDKFPIAEPLLLQALSLRESIFPADAPEIAESLNHLGWLRTQQGDYDEAEAMLARALSIWTNKYGPEHASTALCLENYADMLKKSGRSAEADRLLWSVEKIRRNH